jgi:hypothetical protein
MKVWIPLAFAVAVLPSIARADQCQLVDDEVATRALAALKGNPKVIQFCEPCGDKAPGEPVVANRVAKQRDVSGDYEVTIDRREVDLAYTYVQTGLERYENVAALAGCPASGVSPSLHVAAASTGELITADATPVHVQLAPTEPPPTPPQVTYVVETRTASPSLMTILLACLACSGLWALAAVVLIRRRKIVAMRPRAVELVDRAKRG